MARTKDQWLISEAARRNENWERVDIGCHWVKYATIDGNYQVYLEFKRDGQIKTLRTYMAGDKDYHFITLKKRQRALELFNAEREGNSLWVTISGVRVRLGSIAEAMYRSRPA